MPNLLYPETTGHVVDDKYAKIVEANLWANQPFQPGITYTDKYQLSSAGQIMVHKPGKDVISATHPGADFTHAIVKDSVIPVLLNKQFNRSRKIYGATVATVAYNIVEAELLTATGEVAEAWQKEALNAIVLSEDLTAPEATTALTSQNIYADIVANRKILVKKGAKPDVLIVSPEVFALLLKAPEFQRAGKLGDRAVAEGMVGAIAGLKVFEYQGVSDYKPNAVVAKYKFLVGDKVDYVMYDHDALSIITAVDTVRVIDSPSAFIGILAQVQLVSAFKFTNDDRGLARFTKASPIKYLVEFDTDGGTAVPSQEVAVNGKATTPSPAPTKAGYTFDKWVDEDGATWNFNTVITDNTKLTAVWTE